MKILIIKNYTIVHYKTTLLMEMGLMVKLHHNCLVKKQISRCQNCSLLLTKVPLKLANRNMLTVRVKLPRKSLKAIIIIQVITTLQRSIRVVEVELVVRHLCPSTRGSLRCGLFCRQRVVVGGPRGSWVKVARKRKMKKVSITML